MSTPLHPTPGSTGLAATSRHRVRWRDLAWITWRQHRLLLITTSLLALVVAALLTTLGVLASPSTLAGPLQPFALYVPELLNSLALYPAVVAGFWTAPLIAGEHDQRTHLLAWSQDVSPARWMTGKAVTLGAVAILLALLLGYTSQYLVDRLTELTYPATGWTVWAAPFQTPYFVASPLVLLGYTLFALTLGLALSLLIRRTLPAVGTTLATFLLTRVVITTQARPHYQPLLRHTTPLDSKLNVANPAKVLQVEQGYLDTHGNIAELPHTCAVLSDGPRNTCLRQHGIVREYLDYQPADRLATFQLIEFDIYTALAALLALAVWRLARRPTRP